MIVEKITIPLWLWQRIKTFSVFMFTLLYMLLLLNLKLTLPFVLLYIVLLGFMLYLSIKKDDKQAIKYGLILLIGIVMLVWLANMYATGSSISVIYHFLLKISGLIIILLAYYIYRMPTREGNKLKELKTLFKNQEENLKEIHHPSVNICKNAENHAEEIGIAGKDRYLHSLLIGATGTGKTSTVLAPMVWQDLLEYRKGNSLGITLIAPDYEFCHQVRDWCIQLGVPYTIIDLDDSLNTSHFNPLEGDPVIVSEIMRSVLRATFGEQDAFFAQAQELHAKNTMLLLKRIKGDNLTLLDVYNALMDIEEVQSLVDEYVDEYGEDIVTTYFKKEAFGRNKDKLHQFAMGLRMQISDLLSNETIYNVLVNRSDIDLDKHMAEGGVLLINTALGKMGHMSRVFGQFLIMHIQNAVFRRPGDEFTRIPHYLYVDELPVYYNPELKNLLNLGRKYRCGCTFTIQGPSQLVAGREAEAMREVIINGCRNKIAIGVASSEDAKILSEMFGEEEYKERRATRKIASVMPSYYSELSKDKLRFTYTDIMELKPWHGIVKVVENGRNMPPVEGRFEEPWLFQDKVKKYLENIEKHKVV